MFKFIMFFTITRDLRDAGLSEIAGFALPQALLMGLVWSIAAFVVLSLAGVTFENRGLLRAYGPLRDYGLWLSSSCIALAVTFFFSQTVVQGRTRTFFELAEVRFFVVVGLFFVFIARVLVDLWDHRSEFMGKILGEKREVHFDEYER